MTKTLLIFGFLFFSCFLFAQREFTMQAVGSYTVKDKSKPLRIPFEFSDGDILLKPRINGRICSMYLDNGFIWDELYFFGSPVIDSLNFRYEAGEVQVGGQGSGQPIVNKMANGVNVEFENLTFNDQPAIISPPELGMQKLFRADGQISAVFFKNFITEINFDSMQITLHEPSVFIPGENFEPIPMTSSGDGSFSVPVIIGCQDKKIKSNLRLDLGGSCNFTLYFDGSSGFNFDNDSLKTLGYGSQGEIKGYSEQIQFFSIGKSKIRGLTGEFVRSSSSDKNISILGLEVLKLYNIIFDYHHNILYIKPNHLFHERTIKGK
ncbi:MAG: hypothetical protein WCO02_07750 [Bacteroidota bacterium]